MSMRLFKLSFIHNSFKFLGRSLVVSAWLLCCHFFIKTHPSSWKNACTKVLENIFGYTLFISLKLMKVSEKFYIFKLSKPVTMYFKQNSFREHVPGLLELLS